MELTTFGGHILKWSKTSGLNQLVTCLLRHQTFQVTHRGAEHMARLLGEDQPLLLLQVVALHLHTQVTRDIQQSSSEVWRH